MRKAGAVEHVRIMEDRYGRSLVCEGTGGTWTPTVGWVWGQRGLCDGSALVKSGWCEEMLFSQSLGENHATRESNFLLAGGVSTGGR